MDAVELSTHDVGLLSLFLDAGIIVQAVMAGLVLASVWTWAIVVDKMIAFRRARRADRAFEEAFWSGRSLEDLYRDEAEDARGTAAVFAAAMGEWKKSHEKGARSPFGLSTRIDGAMNVALTGEAEKLDARLGSLATIGSAAPFVGLFGTVIGIMTSFQAIAGAQSTNLAVVAPGIAEALLATAIGLLAAIPAVVAYNKFSADSNAITSRMERFADEFGAILSRQGEARQQHAQPQQPAPRPAPQHAAPQTHGYPGGYPQHAAQHQPQHIVAQPGYGAPAAPVDAYGQPSVLHREPGL